MIKKDAFLTNSLIFFAGSFIVGIGNYLFQFLMARMLTIEDYGELQSLIAVFSIFGIPLAALGAVLIRNTAGFKEEENLGKVKALFSYFSKTVVIISTGLFLILLILNKSILGFLNLNSSFPVIILGISLIPAFLSFVSKSVIQGLEKFKAVSAISIIETSFKIISAFLLVLAGFRVGGAMLAFFISGVISYLISFIPLSFLLKEKEQKIQTKEIFQYFLLALFGISFLNLLFNLDIILVKHFLPSFSAGEYGGLALIGRIIFFLGGPIAIVMFPIVFRNKIKNQNSSAVFKKALLFTLTLEVLPLIAYFLFPDFIIKLLIGEGFLGIKGVLGYFGLAMLSYSLINLFSQYFLSLGEKMFSFFLLGGVLLEIVLISIWHQSIFQIVWIINLINVLILIGLASYYYFLNKRKLWTKN